MLAGERIPINTGTFSNDMTTFQCRDDVLTLLVHLGYLGYHWPDKTVFIPNKEIAQEYINAISMMDWHEVIDSIKRLSRTVPFLYVRDSLFFIFSSPVILRFPLKLHALFVQPPRIVLVALAEW